MAAINEAGTYRPGAATHTTRSRLASLPIDRYYCAETLLQPQGGEGADNPKLKDCAIHVASGYVEGCE